MEISIRRATANDVGAILRLIKELAVYEREPLESVIVTEEVLLRDGFGAEPMFHVLLAETLGAADTEAIGMAFYFYTYSTWRGPMMFLEDLIVSPDHRGRGAGMKLLRSLAEVAQARGCHRLAWQVLDWNEPAIKFYSRIGAQLLKEWIPVRLTKEGIDDFLASFPGPNLHSVIEERP